MDLDGNGFLENELPEESMFPESLWDDFRTRKPATENFIKQKLTSLLYAYKCQQLESQANGEQCTIPNCKMIRKFVNHMRTCQAGKSCPVPDCSSSRQLISHWTNCAGLDCPICPRKQAVKIRSPDAIADELVAHQPSPSTPHKQQANDAAGISCSVSNNQPFNDSQSEFDFQWPKDVPLPEGLTPGQVQAIPLPGTKEWHQSASSDLRNHLVKKFFQAICLTPDSNTTSEMEMFNLAAHARKVESDAYEVANSIPEYYRLLANKAHKWQKKQEEQRKNQVHEQNQPSITIPVQETIKEWHQSVTLDLRNSVVEEIFKVICHTSGPNPLLDNDVFNFVRYARKVEDDLFKVAGSKSVYYDLLNEEIRRIQNGLE